MKINMLPQNTAISSKSALSSHPVEKLLASSSTVPVPKASACRKSWSCAAAGSEAAAGAALFSPSSLKKPANHF